MQITAYRFDVLCYLANNFYFYIAFEQFSQGIKTYIMTSKITIEVDFDNGNLPQIRVINDRNSDDVRDKLITSFRQMFGYTSSWCRVQFADWPQTDDGRVVFFIRPIPPAQLEMESEAMAEQVRLYGVAPKQAPVQH